MGTIVSQVIAALKKEVIRADEAYPGSRIPALVGPVAAVRLGKMDRSVRTTTVQVTIMSPASGGGSVCEDTALQAVEALQAMGATCVKDVCKFDEMADVFYIDISAEFFGTAKYNDWSAGPGYSVTLGLQKLQYVVSFESERKIDDEMTALADAPWEFTLEELLPLGGSEPPEITEPFLLTVSRNKTDEMFGQCTWVSVKRKDTIRGISQIRVGRAQSRAVSSVL